MTNGKQTLLYVDVTTPITTAYDAVTVANAEMVACLDNNGFSLQNADIDATTKCSAGNYMESVLGQQSWSMSGDGKKIVVVSPDTRVDNNALFKLARSGDYAWWFLFDIAQASMRYGLGKISSFDETSPNNDAETFSISITGSGYPGDQDDITP